VTITAVGFDLDDTLLVTERSREAILADVADAHDVSLSREAYLSAHRRHATSETRRAIFAAMTEKADPAAMAASYRTAVGDQLTTVSDCADLLARLHDRYTLGVLTNGPVRAQRDKLSRFDWTDLFTATLVEGELGVGKPDRRAFEALFSALDTTPDTAVFVGNDPALDVQPAAAAGCHTVQVTHPDGPAVADAADADLPRDRLANGLPSVLETFD
jgi:haloacid dehalogenase superfamily, subfamily IA, variant 3 with third motif having DD or ED/haloacid dehalogenase superfamily, subfamily IA, variant 1 with third motif having Dx(3-4)D or Dx(3-4)E